MRLTIAAVGTRLPAWADDAIADLLPRFPSDFSVSVKSVKAAAGGTMPLKASRAAEAERLRAALPPGALLVALDERGRHWTTAELAVECGRWAARGGGIGFAIGGADGLDPDFVGTAHAVLALSKMTLPHALARVMLVEQLYRVWSIGAGHPYHRA